MDFTQRARQSKFLFVSVGRGAQNTKLQKEKTRFKK